MLNIWSEHSQVTYISRLDVVVALLIVIEVGIQRYTGELLEIYLYSMLLHSRRLIPIEWNPTCR